MNTAYIKTSVRSIYVFLYPITLQNLDACRSKTWSMVHSVLFSVGRIGITAPYYAKLVGTLSDEQKCKHTSYIAH